jgi:predicted permease
MATGISWLDVKLGARMLVKNAGLAVVGGLGLAAAIAIGAGFFGFSYTYIKPSTLPLPEGDRVVGIQSWDTEANSREPRVLDHYANWREGLRSAEEVGAFRMAEHNLMVPGMPSEVVRVAEMTASGFRVARVAPLLGRPLADDDQRKGAAPVVVIGEEVWRTQFGRDPAVLGREVRLGSTVHTVVGVMPEGFGFPFNYRMWTPLRADAADFERRQGPELLVFARLARGMSKGQAQTELAAFTARTAAAFPRTDGRIRHRIVPFEALFFNGVEGVELPLMRMAASMLLVVISANVAILVYARTASRRGEITVRTALGASRRRIVAQLFVEALVLSTISAAVGLAIAAAGLRHVFALFDRWGGGLPFWAAPGLSMGTVLYGVALMLLCAVIVGVLPALQATGRELEASLRALGGGTGMQMGRTWTVLIVAQVAIAVAALPVACFPAWQAIRAAAAEPGFEAGEYLSANLVLDHEAPPGMSAEAFAPVFAARFQDRRAELVRRLEAEPSVAGVTLASALPGVEPTRQVAVDGGTDGSSARSIHVDASFFGAFEIPLLAGRRFVQADFGDAPSAVIVNRSFVTKHGGALGGRVRYLQGGKAAGEERWYEIVGVVDDFPNVMGVEQTSVRVYHPMAPGHAAPVSLAVRVKGATPAASAARIREIATSLDPALQTRDLRTLDDVLRSEQGAWRITALGITTVALSVLLLSAGGIYALLSFAVTQRRREIGIRSALGAHPRQILGAVFARAMRQLGLGVALGVVAAALVLRSVSVPAGAMAAAVLAVSVLITIVGLLAAMGPARRGLRIAPSEALRADV